MFIWRFINKFFLGFVAAAAVVVVVVVVVLFVLKRYI
jgi:hypothetical protein